MHEEDILVREQLDHSIPDKIVANVRISKRLHPVVQVLAE